MKLSFRFATVMMTLKTATTAAAVTPKMDNYNSSFHNTQVVRSFNSTDNEQHIKQKKKSLCVSGRLMLLLLSSSCANSSSCRCSSSFTCSDFFGWKNSERLTLKASMRAHNNSNRCNGSNNHSTTTTTATTATVIRFV